MAGIRERTAVITAVETATRSGGRFRPRGGGVGRREQRRGGTGDDEGDIDALPAGQAVTGQIRCKLSKATTHLPRLEIRLGGLIQKGTETRSRRAFVSAGQSG